MNAREFCDQCAAVSHTPAMSVEPDSYGFCLFDNAETLVARVFSYGDDKAPNTAEAKANADLFAAAPDLLEALKDVRRWLDTLPADIALGSIMPDKLDATIAKAEGR